jgi:hypothetical protein
MSRYASIARQFFTPSAAFLFGEFVSVERQRDGYYTVTKINGVMAFDVAPHMLDLR